MHAGSSNTSQQNMTIGSETLPTIGMKSPGQNSLSRHSNTNNSLSPNLIIMYIERSALCLDRDGLRTTVFVNLFVIYVAETEMVVTLECIECMYPKHREVRCRHPTEADCKCTRWSLSFWKIGAASLPDPRTVLRRLPKRKP